MQIFRNLAGSDALSVGEIAGSMLYWLFGCIGVLAVLAVWCLCIFAGVALAAEVSIYFQDRRIVIRVCSLSGEYTLADGAE